MSFFKKLIFLQILLMSSLSMAFLGFNHQFKQRQRNSILLKRYLTTTIVTVGKKNGIEPWIAAGCTEYEKRISSTMSIKTLCLKNDDALIDSVKTLRGTIIALDENGKEFTSREFSSYFYKALESGGAHTSFLIGGYGGLPKEIKNNYPLISIGKMTWTHQMARLLLLEQLYRALEIRKGSGYHKD
mmetsp:Transcript_19698/g.19798  ORF Transcript_19698/g.19798 Transcript_19698/m.19798 type:complete len:186 (+) Transcript_19698:354-911(+)